MLGYVAHRRGPDLTLWVKDAGAALDSERPARRGQRPEPVVAEQRGARIERNVRRQAARPRPRLACGGDAGLEHPVPAEVGPLGAGPVEDVGRPLGCLAEDLADPRERPLVEVAGERGLEAHALAVDARVDLRPLGRRRDREHDVDASVTDEVGQRSRAQELVLRHHRADAGYVGQLEGSRPQRLVHLWAPAQRRQEARVEDDRVEADPAHPSRHRPNERVGVEDPRLRVATERVQVVLDRRAQRVLHQPVDDEDRSHVVSRLVLAQVVRATDAGVGALVHRSPREVERQGAQEVAVLGAQPGIRNRPGPGLLEGTQFVL